MMFGHGKYACPGRFYAEYQSKIIIAYLVTRYDLKLADGCSRPASICFADVAIPSQTQKILFRSRMKGGCESLEALLPR